MKLRFTRRAIQDIVEIAGYIRTHNAEAAERVRGSILETIGLLVEFPDAGREQSIPGTRRLVTRKYRYLVYYRVDRAQDVIAILSIQHPSRERDPDR